LLFEFGSILEAKRKKDMQKERNYGEMKREQY